MTLNCIIIDDEPLAAELLASYARKTLFLNLIGVFNSAVEGIKVIRENRVDLIFLDIQMPELSGLEFAKILPKETKIIFTTAFSQYAVDGYKANAVDYLMKPVSYDDFLAGANRALEWFRSVRQSENASDDRFIFVKSEYKLVKIMFDDILYIEGLKDYVKIYLTDGRDPVMSLMNMKKIEESLPKPEFMRIHRSYIVHMRKIEGIDRFRVVIGNAILPISDSYKTTIQDYLDGHTL
ncbi:LytR/AlgR family response regulator transcription factor [Prevotella denticola]|uniref:Response regulator receiver domain protein n=2 Tax=Prevotella denticola TaxID=28129 RepID=F0H8E5_9BACT|nr:LytTR family DNA-binding domain-containing protein [Prevotella denticola]EGC85875.1 response regulator receiver domain protein [Prevotella denticola CRIS 18C-A]KGF41425.1 chemotaxis protein CheY [Prevotella denticola DNF00960]MBF1387547.1 response regulator transcription factor [Prevotella denticola]MBW4898156.1 LytTR family DNA-binding domain-containing protein [Prevotella denticola]SUB94643.1 Probable transcriptional regulatory protein YehT [Prevotella denticola]